MLGSDWTWLLFKGDKYGDFQGSVFLDYLVGNKPRKVKHKLFKATHADLRRGYEDLGWMEHELGSSLPM